jgi:hypothetical protein
MDETKSDGGRVGDSVQNTQDGAEAKRPGPALQPKEPHTLAVLLGGLTLARTRDFLKITGTGILYALSALSILYGIGRIIGPVLATSGKLGETLPCFGALQGYELAVFGVLLLIVLWRRSTRDTTTLMVLVALFMAASGITLATIANDGPEITVAIGLACMVVALAKLWVLRVKVGMASSRLFAAGLTVLLVWNFLISAYVALTLHREWSGSGQLRLVWLGGWHIVMISGLLFFLSALACHTRGARRTDEETPFLRSTSMAWVFASVLVCGAVVHQYALTYIFDLPFDAGDFLPLAILGILTLLEALRGYGWHEQKHVTAALALAPFVFTFAIVNEQAFMVAPQWGLGMLVQPWMALATSGLILLVIAVRRRDKLLGGFALLYAPFVALLLGALPEFTVRTLDLYAFGAVLIAVVFALAAMYRSVKLALVAITLLALGAMLSEQVNAMAEPVLASRLNVFLALLGAGALGLYLGFPRHVNWGLGIAGAACMAVAALYGQPPTLTVHAVALAVAFAALGVIVLWRTHDFVTMGMLTVPFAWRTATSIGEITGWHYIALSFVLLGAAAFFSLRSHRTGGG